MKTSSFGDAAVLQMNESRISNLARRTLALLLHLLICISSVSVWSFEVTVSTDRLALNKTLQLTVTSFDQTDLNLLDLGQLDADFIVSRPDISSFVNIINGQRSSKQTLTATLQPRRKGQLNIPSFRIGKRASKPIAITVSDPTPLPDKLYDGVIRVTAELSKSTLVPRESVVYSIKLYYMIDQESRLGDLSIPDADIEPLEPKAYRETLGGQQYAVQEQRFIVTPKQAQSYTIISPVIKGQIYQNGRGVFRRGGLPFEVQAKPLQLKVNPLPPDVPDDTLVASELSIATEPLTSNVFTVGEPITRRIFIQAKGVKAESLPKIIMREQNGMNVYQEPSGFHNEEWLGGYAGRRTETYALIPTVAGKLQLPEVAFNWWDTSSNSLKVARLPAQDISILPGGNSGTSYQPGTSQDTNTTDPGETTDGSLRELSDAATQSQSIQPVTDGGVGSKSLITTLKISTAVLCTLVVFLLLWIVKLKSQATRADGSDSNADKRESAAEKTRVKTLIAAIASACDKNDAGACKNALNRYFSWRDSNFKANWPLDSKLALAQERLNQTLFSGSGEASSDWNQTSIADLVRQDLETCQRLAQENLSADSRLTAVYPSDR